MCRLVKGCGIVVLVILGLVIAAVTLIGRAVREAKQIEQTLNERWGEAPAFVPAPDGSIPAERIEAFLRVRERLHEHCSVFQDKLGILVRMDQLEQNENVSKTAVAREGIGGLKELLKLGPAFVRFMEARNQALLDEEMGLGEYMYIYVVAYAEQLLQVADSPFAAMEEARVGDRARTELTQILRNQLDLLESGEGRSVQMDLAADLRDQIAGLGSGRQNLPWEDGLPPAIAASFEPHAEALARSYCEGIAKIELTQKNKGLNVRN